MNKYELFACGQYLCKWPEGKGFEEVMDLLEAGDESVEVWAPFENHEGYDVRKLIEDMSDDLERVFLPREK